MMKNKQTYEIVLTGLGMALVFVATMFIKVPNALDGTNDVDMLKMADVGVAMGNACDALKEVSDVVIGRVDEDGIYNFLMRK